MTDAFEELFRSYAANEALHQLEVQLEALRNKPTPSRFEQVHRAAERFAEALDWDEEDRLTEQQWREALRLAEVEPHIRGEEDEE